MNAVTADERGQLPGVSVVIPVPNAGEILDGLCASLAAALAATGAPHEAFLVNDGRRDSIWNGIRRLAAATPGVRAIARLRNYGLYNALPFAGLRHNEACDFKIAATQACFHWWFRDRD